ncbi:hypothetical protein SNEBB_001167, partial [Seison nebaliae]
VQENEKFSLRK